MPKSSGSATRGRKPWPNSKRPAASIPDAICGSAWAKCAWKWAAWTRPRTAPIKRSRTTSSWRRRGASAAEWPARGDQLLASGNRDQARALYVQALNDLHRAAGYDSSDRQVIGETAAVYRSLAQPQRALESMQSLAETYSPGDEPQQVLYLTGLDYMALHRYDDAAASLSAALAHGQPSPELLYNLAQAQYRGGHSQEAADSLQRALVIDPQHLLSRQLLGQIEVARQGGPATWR